VSTTPADNEYLNRITSLLAADTPADVRAWIDREYPDNKIGSNELYGWEAGTLRGMVRWLLERLENAERELAEMHAAFPRYADA
jgi:hypothetical protein